MHEIGVVRAMVKTVTDYAAANQIDEISEIVADCGELSLVIPEEAKKTFHDLRGVFTEEQMKKETERCLGCGAVVLNEDQCIGCGICTTKCKFDAIRLEKVNDTHGREYFRTLLTVAGNTPAAIGRLVRKTRGR